MQHATVCFYQGDRDQERMGNEAEVGRLGALPYHCFLDASASFIIIIIPDDSTGFMTTPISLVRFPPIDTNRHSMKRV